jgi:23S rRNA (guanosine2251-2'-O)-methyltransferase
MRRNNKKTTSMGTGKVKPEQRRRPFGHAKAEPQSDFPPRKNRPQSGAKKSWQQDAPVKSYGKKPKTSDFKPQAPKPPRPKLLVPQLDKPRLSGHWLYGLHAVKAAWLNPRRKCRRICLTSAMRDAFAATLAAAALQDLQRPEPELMERGALDTMLPHAVHQGIALEVSPLAEMSLPDLLAQKPRLVLALDQVTDPHNVGAILRSAAAFGAEGVLITERHAPGMTGILAKTASGALDYVPLVVVVNLARALEQMRAAGFWCIGLAEEGTQELGSIDLDGRLVLVLGAEGDGLRRLTRERCDVLARLPTEGEIGSVNVSNAAAIALYETKRQKFRRPA